jgi:hypothetical protein
MFLGGTSPAVHDRNSRLGRGPLILPVVADHRQRGATTRLSEIGRRPEVAPVSLHGESLSKTAGRHPLKRVHELGKLDRRPVPDQEVNVIVLPVTLCEFAIEIGTNGDQYRSHVVEHGPGEHPVNPG